MGGDVILHQKIIPSPAGIIVIQLTVSRRKNDPVILFEQIENEFQLFGRTEQVLHNIIQPAGKLLCRMGTPFRMNMADPVILHQFFAESDNERSDIAAAVGGMNHFNQLHVRQFFLEIIPVIIRPW